MMILENMSALAQILGTGGEVGDSHTSEAPLDPDSTIEMPIINPDGLSIGPQDS